MFRLQRSPYLSIAGLVLLASVVASCAPRMAAYEPIQALLEQRSGLDAPWRLVEDGAAMDQRIVELLAGPLGVAEAVEVALLNNADLQAAFEDLEIARSALVGASLPPNVHFDSEFLSAEERSPKNGFEFMTGVSDLLFLPLRRGVASAGMDVTRVQIAGTVLDFMYLVRNAYYDYQAAGQSLELTRTVLNATAASYEFAQRLRGAGNITALDLANERAFYEEARVEVALAEATALNRREELNALMGLWGSNTEWELAGRLDEPRDDAPDLINLEERAIEQSLELMELEHRYTAVARRANLARAEGLLPSLRAGIGFSRENNVREIGPVVTIELPIFNRGQGPVGIARAEMRQVEQLYRASAVEIRAAIRAARNDLLIAAQRAEHYRTVLLPLREEILEQTQQQYNAMQIGVFQLIAARKDQIRTGQEYVATLRDYWHAQSALDQILDGRLPERARARTVRRGNS